MGGGLRDTDDGREKDFSDCDCTSESQTVGSAVDSTAQLRKSHYRGRWSIPPSTLAPEQSRSTFFTASTSGLVAESRFRVGHVLLQVHQPHSESYLPVSCIARPVSLADIARVSLFIVQVVPVIVILLFSLSVILIVES